MPCSARSELAHMELMGRGYASLDTGTHTDQWGFASLVRKRSRFGPVLYVRRLAAAGG
jgi:hypothetical protein